MRDEHYAQRAQRTHEQRATITLLAVLFILILLPQLSSAQEFHYIINTPITTTQPLIKINYWEEPINITQATLEYSDLHEGAQLGPVGLGYTNDVCPERSTTIPVPDGCGARFYNFTITEHLWDGEYVFSAQAVDTDMNELEFTITFTIQAESSKIRVITPRVRYDETSHYSFTNTTPFNTTITATYTDNEQMVFPIAYCYAVYTQNIHNPPQGSNLANPDQELFNYISLIGAPFVPVGVTPPHNKTILLDPSAIQFYDEGDVVSTYVICNESNRYHSQQLWVGYDTTPPVIDAQFERPVMIDPSTSNAKLIITTDDRTTCEVIAHSFPENGLILPPQYYFNYNSISNYTKQQNLSVNYQEVVLPDRVCRNQPCEHVYNVTCTNMAGLSSTVQATHRIALEFDLDVNIRNPRYSQSPNIVLNATTNIQAQCSYRRDNQAPVEMTNREQLSGGLWQHTMPVVLPGEGSYDFEVVCSSGMTSGNDNAEIVVDTAPPIMQGVNITSKPLCGNSNLQARFHANDTQSGIGYYNYTVLANTTTTIRNWTTTSSSTMSMSVPQSPGTTYTVKAHAFDRSGRKSATDKEDTVTYQHANHTSCDTTAPTGTAVVTHTPTGALINVTCVDNAGGSGCQDNYYYQLVSLGTTCDQATYAGAAHNGGGVSITNDQTMCWQVRDRAGNTYNGETSVSVTLDIDLVTPRFGYGSNFTFRLEFSTDREATCKLGLTGGAQHSEQEWYTIYTHPFTQSGGNTHTYNSFNIRAPPFSASTCQGIPDCIQEFVVACFENNRYHTKRFMLGYLTTPPSITTWANPNPVIEPFNLVSTLHVTSNQDVWCRYEQEENPPAQPVDEESDSSNPAHYKKQFQTPIGPFNPPEGEHTSYSTTYEVTCFNLALVQTKKNVTLTIQPRNDIDITIHTPTMLATRSFLINASTDRASTCQYQLGTQDTKKPLASTGGFTHSATGTVTTDDEYRLIITCTAGGGAQQAVRSKNLVIDATAPVMLNITTTTPTCSLTQLRATLIADASIVGLSAYNYTILDAQQQPIIDWKRRSASGTTVITEPHEMITGETYTWKARAIDLLGRSSNELTRTVTAQGPEHPDCDTTPPVGSIRFEDYYGGAHAHITCADTQSGCIDAYDVKFIPGASRATCTDENYTSTTNNPYDMTMSGTVCYILYDAAGNTYKGSGHHRLMSSCSNAVQDPDEEGVDCGGVCPFSCAELQELLGTCQTDNDCSLGEQCVSGRCAAQTLACINDYDCPLDKRCESGVCVDESSTGIITCTQSTDCPEGQICRAGTCVIDDYIPSTRPEKDNTLALVLLLIGIFFILGGTGYLVYDHYYLAPRRKPQQPLSGVEQQSPSGPNYEEQLAEQRLLEAAREQAMRERLVLQKQMRDRRQQEKTAQRRALLSSFKEETPTETSAQRSEEKSKSAERLQNAERSGQPINAEQTSERGAQLTDRTQTNSAQNPRNRAQLTDRTQRSEPLKQSAERGSQTEHSVQNPRNRAQNAVVSPPQRVALRTPTAPRVPNPSNTDPFVYLSELSGKNPEYIKKLLTTNPKPRTISNLLSETHSSKITPTKMTPVLGQLVEQGHLKRREANSTVNELHKQKKLTDKQREQLLKDLP